jgi:hypothetical protein
MEILKSQIASLNEKIDDFALMSIITLSGTFTIRHTHP